MSLAKKNNLASPANIHICRSLALCKILLFPNLPKKLTFVILWKTQRKAVLHKCQNKHPLYCHLKSRQNKRIFLVTPMIRPGFSSPPRSSHGHPTPRVSLHPQSLQNGEISQVFFSNMSFCYLLLDLDTQRRIEIKQSLYYTWLISFIHSFCMENFPYTPTILRYVISEPTTQCGQQIRISIENIY